MNLATLAKKVRPKCDHCGSSDIRVEAYVTWSAAKQNWEIKELTENQICNECGRGCKARWVLA